MRALKLEETLKQEKSEFVLGRKHFQVWDGSGNKFSSNVSEMGFPVMKDLQEIFMSQYQALVRTPPRHLYTMFKKD